MEIFEPAGEVELAGSEVAAGDEVENGVLKVGGELDECVAGAGAGEEVEFVEAEPIVEGWKRSRVEGESLAGAVSEGVNLGGERFCVGVQNESSDGLKGGELGGVHALRDVNGPVVDKLLETNAGSWFGDRVGVDEVLVRSTDGHDTTLLLVRLTFVSSLDDGMTRKSLV